MKSLENESVKSKEKPSSSSEFPRGKSSSKPTSIRRKKKAEPEPDPTAGTVGCFELLLVDPVQRRWRVTNLRTTHTHVTYGTWAEVREQAEIQTREWEERFVRFEKTAKTGRGTGGKAARQGMNRRVPLSILDARAKAKIRSEQILAAQSAAAAAFGGWPPR